MFAEEAKGLLCGAGFDYVLFCPAWAAKSSLRKDYLPAREGLQQMEPLLLNCSEPWEEPLHPSFRRKAIYGLSNDEGAENRVGRSVRLVFMGQLNLSHPDVRHGRKAVFNFEHTTGHKLANVNAANQ